MSKKFLLIALLSSQTLGQLTVTNQSFWTLCPFLMAFENQEYLFVNGQGNWEMMNLQTNSISYPFKETCLQSSSYIWVNSESQLLGLCTGQIPFLYNIEILQNNSAGLTNLFPYAQGEFQISGDFLFEFQDQFNQYTLFMYNTVNISQNIVINVPGISAFGTRYFAFGSVNGPWVYILQDFYNTSVFYNYTQSELNTEIALNITDYGRSYLNLPGMDIIAIFDGANIAYIANNEKRQTSPINPNEELTCNSFTQVDSSTLTYICKTPYQGTTVVQTSFSGNAEAQIKTLALKEFYIEYIQGINYTTKGIGWINNLCSIVFDLKGLNILNFESKNPVTQLSDGSLWYNCESFGIYQNSSSFLVTFELYRPYQEFNTAFAFSWTMGLLQIGGGTVKSYQFQIPSFTNQLSLLAYAQNSKLITYVYKLVNVTGSSCYLSNTLQTASNVKIPCGNLVFIDPTATTIMVYNFNQTETSFSLLDIQSEHVSNGTLRYSALVKIKEGLLGCFSNNDQALLLMNPISQNIEQSIPVPDLATYMFAQQGFLIWVPLSMISNCSFNSYVLVNQPAAVIFSIYGDYYAINIEGGSQYVEFISPIVNILPNNSFSLMPNPYLYSYGLVNWNFESNITVGQEQASFSYWQYMIPILVILSGIVLEKLFKKNAKEKLEILPMLQVELHSDKEEL